MGDDLAAFFAKKKSKGTKKKAIRLDDVGQQLELNLKLEKDFAEEEVNTNTESRVIHTEEDSDWIDYDSKNLNLAGETVGTFNFNDQADDEVVSDDSDKESTPVEKTKTWNMPSKDQPPAKETVISAVTTTQSKFEPYKPPTQRTNQQAQVKKQKVDLHNEEMFPSLGDADKIEKQQTDDQKKQRVEEKSASPAVESRPDPFQQTAPPASRPAPRPAPPSGDVGTGVQNAKGEWIFDKKEEPKAESKPEVTPWRRTAQAPTPATETDNVPKPAPTPRVAPPTGNIGTGVKNGKGEWIVLKEEAKEEPKPEVKPEVVSWRRQGPPAPVETKLTSWRRQGPPPESEQTNWRRAGPPETDRQPKKPISSRPALSESTWRKPGPPESDRSVRKAPTPRTAPSGNSGNQNARAEWIQSPEEPKEEPKAEGSSEDSSWRTQTKRRGK